MQVQIRQYLCLDQAIEIQEFKSTFKLLFHHTDAQDQNN